MTSQREQLKASLASLKVERAPEELRALLDGVRRRERARRVRRAVALSAAAALLVGMFAFALYSPQHTPTRLADGSRLEPLTDATRLRVVGAPTADRVAVELERGEARFEVTSNPERVFEVAAGHVTVKVLGTRFEVHRRSDEVAVTVEEGLVAISSRGRTWKLPAGARGVFPFNREATVLYAATARPTARPSVALQENPASAEDPRPRLEAVVPEPEEDSVPEEAAGPEAPGAPTAARAVVEAPVTEPGLEGDWRALARAGKAREAAALIRARPALVGTGVDDLMLAADVMRRAGQPARALTYLGQVQRRHPGDPRASVAAFTRARILLYQMGRPREAAQAFAQVSSRGGALAQDALAREVEAWSRAGNKAKARQRATLYLKRYPNGPRAKLVRHHGGIE